ncbi:MAG: hypothetical protein LBH43_12005 [Treponema sp.]|jgi:hypothetical protein|nr:hypothetical protein [Treponema sp.]
MGRDELLRRKKEMDEALKEISQKYKAPAGIKYNFCNEAGGRCGSVEYDPENDTVKIFYTGSVTIDGGMLKPLRDALNKLLDE